MDRYVSAAEKISRLALGRPTDTIRTPPDLTQEQHFDELPVGTRGGAVVRYTFPLGAEYDIRIRLTRDRNEHVEGLSEPHELELLLDRERVQVFTVTPPPSGKDHRAVDQNLKVRIPVEAGPHVLGVTFLKNPSVLLETQRQPYEAHFNFYRHPRIQPAIFSISITGPYAAKGPGNTPSRRRILVCRPEKPGEEEGCPKVILRTLVRRAYRRPVTDVDLQRPLEFYREARREGDFEAGIQMALSAVLVSPEFLFRIEQAPAGVAPNTAYRISEVELASRLSFFLWSSIPDDELLDAAIRGDLKKPAVLEQQVNLGNTRLNKLAATPFFFLAAHAEDAELMRALAALGADPLLPNAENSTPLMAATGLGTRSPGEDAGTEPEVLEAVLAALELGADIDAIDDNGETAMHGAAYKNLPKVVELLAEKGAKIEIWNQKNRQGWTPLTIAEGHRFGNFKPSPVTVAAFHRVMSAAGVSTAGESHPVHSAGRKSY